MIRDFKIGPTSSIDTIVPKTISAGTDGCLAERKRRGKRSASEPGIRIVGSVKPRIVKGGKF